MNRDLVVGTGGERGLREERAGGLVPMPPQRKEERERFKEFGLRNGVALGTKSDNSLRGNRRKEDGEEKLSTGRIHTC